MDYPCDVQMVGEIIQWAIIVLIVLYLWYKQSMWVE